MKSSIRRRSSHRRQNRQQLADELKERNLVTATELDTVNSQEAVLDILNLIKTLFGTAHLEQIVVIYKEIML